MIHCNLQLALLPFIYLALNFFLLDAGYGFDNVSLPLVLLSSFNVVILSLIVFTKQRKLERIYFSITPIFYCVFFLYILLFHQSDFREYEASDSFIYDHLASLLSKPDGLNAVLNTKYSYDDLGYPFIRNIFSAYNGSNVALFLFKLVLHYISSILLVMFSKKYTSEEVAYKVGLFYLNTSVALYFVMSGLKESIFTFLVFASLVLLQKAFIFGALMSSLTFFFRKVYPLLLMSFYVVSLKEVGVKLRVFVGILVLLLISFMAFNTEFFNMYINVFFHYYDEILLFASFVSGMIGGLVTIDGSDLTNYIYSPTVFVVNFLMIQAFIGNGWHMLKSRIFWVLLIFALPLIFLMQAIKVRYLAPFYGLYVLLAFGSLKKTSSYTYFVSLVLFLSISISWNVLSN